MSAEATTATMTATNFVAQLPGALPATYVESDPAECSTAKLAHIMGIFGILGTGIFYVVKKNDAGKFALDQMKEAFNFHLLVFVVMVALSIVGAVAAAVVGVLGLIFSLASFALLIGGLVLSILNGLKAGKGNVARYPARLPVLK
jgi:uncharacterized Tic20 family protein